MCGCSISKRMRTAAAMRCCVRIPVAQQSERCPNGGATGARTRKLLLLPVEQLHKGLVANSGEMFDQLHGSTGQQACVRRYVSGEAKCYTPCATHQRTRAINQPRALLREGRRPSTPTANKGRERKPCAAQQRRRTRLLTYGNECSKSRDAGSRSSAGRAASGRAPPDAPASLLVSLSVDAYRAITPAVARTWPGRHSQAGNARSMPAHAPVRCLPGALVEHARQAHFQSSGRVAAQPRATAFPWLARLREAVGAFT
jgi:hypothetical protein